MGYDDFIKSLEEKFVPEVNPLLQALWYEKNNNWNKAHNIAQDIESADGSWVHAYLHKVEGDNWNANYWYRKAGRKMTEQSLEKEWEELVKYFIELY